MRNKILKLLLLLIVLQQLCYAQINITDIPISTVAGNNQVENAVFISPLSKYVIINSNNSAPNLQTWDVSYFISTTAGQSWSGNISMPNQDSHADPSVVIDRSGRIIVSNLAYPSPRHLNISYTDDYGANWTTVQVPGSIMADKQHLWVDNNLNSPYEGRVYTAFNDASSNWFDIVFTYSIDGGATWLTPPLENISATVSPPPDFENLGVNIQSGPQGQVYTCWSTIDSPNSNQANNTRIYFNKSLDGGNTWLTKAINIATVTGLYNNGVKSAFKMFPSMAVNQQTGTIYLVYDVDNNPHPIFIDGDINMIKSEDEGNTWTTPVRVNQDILNNVNDQWDPWIACDEISNALVVVYYDSRNFPADDRAETFVSISYDDGNNWTDYQISDVSEDWSGQAYSNPGMDYIQVDAYHGYVVPVWSDNRPSAGSDFRAYTNPFEVPCPYNLDLIYGNYNIFDQGDYTDYQNQLYDGLYRTTGTLTVAGNGSTYKVHQGAEVLMEAGEEIVLNDGFESEGEFQAIINPACNSFSEKWSSDNYSNEEQPSGIDYEVPNTFSEQINKKDEILHELVEFAIHPNPNNGNMNVEYEIPETETGTFEVYNMLGEKLFSYSLYSGKNTFSISRSDLREGIYFYRAIAGNKQIAADKIVIIK